LIDVFNFRVGIMRFISVLALMTSAVSLAACAGGGGDSAGGGTLSAAGMRAGVNGVCVIGQSNCIPPEAPPTPGTDGDNDGTDNGDDTDGNTGGGAGGNNANITVGNRAIALQKMVYTKPTEPGASFARSMLSSNETVSVAATEAAILSGVKPKTLKMTTDTNAANNSQFAVPVMMNENVYGSRDLRWIALGHTTTPVNNIVIYDKPVGDPTRRAMYYDRNSNGFRYLDATTLTGFSTGNPADVADDFIWNQIVPYMGSKANGGAGVGYREYSVESKTDNRDELLQVWAWGDSYTAQYQNQLGGGTPKQQAWSFGGRATTVMPTGGTATYRGRYVGTADASGWGKIGDTIDPNVPWMVQGSAELTANFDTNINTVDGLIKTESWTSYQEKLKGWYTWNTANAATPVAGNINGTPSVESGVEPNYKFYYSELKLAGTIVDGDTTVTTTGPTGPVTTRVRNAIVGTASFAGDYSTSDNPMLGGFFGTNASEVTGVFTASGVTSDPNGGSTGITDPRSAEIIINGSYNACNTAAVPPACGP
jgi:hypothetical protein